VPTHLDLLVFNWQDRAHPSAGGAETNLHEIFGRLAARGHGVTVVSSAWPGAARREWLDGMDVHRVGDRWSYPFAARTHYRRVLRHQPIDLVIEDLNKVPIATPVWVREPVILLVHHLFGGSAFAAANPVVATITVALERLLLPFYARRPIVAVSESSAAEVRRQARHAAPVHVIHNGVSQPDADAGETARSADPLFLYVGRLQRYKGVDLCIRAIAQLVQTHPAARLVVVGRGPDEHRLRQLSGNLGIARHIEFLGFVSEAEKSTLMRRAWANVICSVKEGWGISILEAAREGTLSIASDSPGLRDAVRHDDTGLLVPHGDIEALTNAMRAIVDNSGLRLRLGRNARVHAAGFSWDRAATAFEQLFANQGLT
jgi:glycosyltransferase involved in cell wall biosynthesis